MTSLLVASHITSTMSIQEFDELCNSIPGYQFNGNYNNRLVLNNAAHRGNADIVEHIVKKCGQQFLDSSKSCYASSLFVAIECKDKSKAYETVKRLVDLGADVNESYHPGQTSLSEAAVAIENLQIVIFLLKKGAKLNREVSENEENIINLAKQEIEKEKEINKKKAIILLSGLQDQNSIFSISEIVKDVTWNIICIMAKL